ncbi:IS1595 family transposase [Aurantimonas sp. A3-2-R12]|uniref:IS1595 family transposase n=1 Tax=Aurantimonas sp. A3-2-R12 TaxID=3114362 RepID=UPI002E19ED2A|nr:IS1595 family transposase [Aurantimonas sp. A3-2-R12]
MWPNGPVCPHCGGVERISAMKGKSTRIGTYKCYQCRKPFTVKVGTVFEASHVKMHLWLQVIFLMASSKKGISSNQLHRTLGVTLKTAWFMSYRIREAMRDGSFGPLGGNGEIVEVDETYFERRAEKRTTKTSGEPLLKRGTGPSNKRAVLSLVERHGSVRSFHVAPATKQNVATLVSDNIAHESMLFTDESHLYPAVGATFLDHMTVEHPAGEYVRGGVPTNTVESYFSIFKRGMQGTYQHCAEKHLHRYLAEFDFRHNRRIALGVNDVAGADRILDGVVGKWLTYETAQGR